jgi:hypothetical protein
MATTSLAGFDMQTISSVELEIIFKLLPLIHLYSLILSFQGMPEHKHAYQ